MLFINSSSMVWKKNNRVSPESVFKTLLVAKNIIMFQYDFFKFCSRVILLFSFLYNSRVKLVEIFSIEFLSGPKPGQSKTLTFCAKNHCFEFCSIAVFKFPL